MTANPNSAPLAAAPGHAAPTGRLKPVDPLKMLRQYRWLLVVTAIFEGRQAAEGILDYLEV